MAEFIGFHNQRRYHEGIGNVAPADIYYGRRDEILKQREVVKQQTMRGRFLYNPTQPGGSRTVRLSLPKSGYESQRC